MRLNPLAGVNCWLQFAVTNRFIVLALDYICVMLTLGAQQRRLQLPEHHMRTCKPHAASAANHEHDEDKQWW